MQVCESSSYANLHSKMCQRHVKCYMNYIRSIPRCYLLAISVMCHFYGKFFFRSTTTATSPLQVLKFATAMQECTVSMYNGTTQMQCGGQVFMCALCRVSYHLSIGFRGWLWLRLGIELKI